MTLGSHYSAGFLESGLSVSFKAADLIYPFPFWASPTRVGLLILTAAHRVFVIYPSSLAGRVSEVGLADILLLARALHRV